MNLWAESEIIENEGKRYLNREATKRFLEAYKDRLKITLAPDVDPDDVLIGYDYATKVVKKYPVENKLENVFNKSFSLYDFLDNGTMPVASQSSFEFTMPNNSDEKQLPIVVPQAEFIVGQSKPFNKLEENVSEELEKPYNLEGIVPVYTAEELKVIEYFEKEGKVDLFKIPQILKGKGFYSDDLIKYGELLSEALTWYTFTDSDKQKLKSKLNKSRTDRLLTSISAAISLDEIIELLKEYKRFGNVGCSKVDLSNAIINFLTEHLVTDHAVKNFWDELSNDEVYEGLYLKEYLARVQPFSSIVDSNIIELAVTNDNVITLDDLNNFDNSEIYDNVKEYIEKYLIIHGEKLNLTIDKIEWIKKFIDDIYNENEITDNKVLLNTLYQCLADRYSLNISRSDINEAFEQFKSELENSSDSDIKGKISKCVNFENTYNGLLKIYGNSSIDKWSKYDEYVIMYVKDKIDYSNELDTEDAYSLHIKSLGTVMLDIKKLSDTKQTDTFKSLASSLNMTEGKLYELVLDYTTGIGDPIKDFGLRKAEPERDSNESFTIKKRRKPKTKQEIKKYIFTALAGAGIISCLYLTFVLKRNPITVIKNCATTFSALFTGNSSLAALGASMGNLTAYFGSAIVAIGSGIKLGKIIEKEDDTESTNQDNSQNSEPLYEELEPSNSYEDNLDNLVDEINDEISEDEPVDLTDMDLSDLMEDDNSFYGKRR